MKQFGKILKFELKGYFTNKVFVGITVFLVAALFILLFFPRVVDIVEGGEPEATPPGDEVIEKNRVMLISGKDSEIISQVFNEVFLEYSIVSTDKELDEIKSDIREGRAECAFVFDSITSYTYYVDNLSMYDANTMLADEAILTAYRLNSLISLGMTPEEANKLLYTEITSNTEKLGKDQMENFFYTYIMIFALYMVILMYGQLVATNVATEKSSRAMELLVTSARPTSMMFGKVLASCIAGLTQLVTVFGSALLFYNINKDYWSGNMIIDSIVGMPVDLFVFMLLFFVLGFLIYAFMYGAIGSTASKLEDINTSTMPITLLFVIGFMVVIFAMTSGDIDSALMKVCSFVPFTSPMAMFTRIAMSTVPAWEIALSVVLLIGSVVGIGILAAKIYRIGVLMYGTPPKIKEIINALKKA